MTGPSNYMSLLVNHASMTGFVVSDYGEGYAEGVREMTGWLTAGKLVSREDIAEGGLERFPETLLRLFEGTNTGKLVLQSLPTSNERVGRSRRRQPEDRAPMRFQIALPETGGS